MNRRTRVVLIENAKTVIGLIMPAGLIGAAIPTGEWRLSLAAALLASVGAAVRLHDAHASLREAESVQRSIAATPRQCRAARVRPPQIGDPDVWIELCTMPDGHEGEHQPGPPQPAAGEDATP